MAATEAIVRPGDPIGRISPRLYGTFAEHLGRCCYDGLWAGVSSDIPDVDGFATCVVDALRELPTTLIRWPGGCFADHYHWRDGIGDPATRPGTLGTSCGLRVPDDNSLGTHEFLNLCELLGAEPYIAGNVGSGTVQELVDWVVYVNSDVDCTLTRMRAANGRATSWGVRLWGVGNESWDCGGKYDAISYAKEYRGYATMLRHIDPTIELVAVGLEDQTLPESALENDWNDKVLATLGPNANLVDHLSVHKYWINGGPERAFGETEYYALLAEAAATEGLIERTAEVIARQSPKRRIGIALDEWGVWHPEARDWGPSTVTPRSPVTYEQANTMRDALAAAVALEGFHRQCAVLSMANLAQVVNVLHSLVNTDDQRTAVKTPTFHAFALHRPHIGATALKTQVECSVALPDGTPAISATASRSDDGIAVTLINRHLEREVSATIGGGELAAVRGTLLTAEPNDQNTAAEPDRVGPKPLELRHADAGDVVVSLPAHSMATVEFRRSEGRP